MTTDQDKPTRWPTAFSGLQAVSEAGLEVSDNVHEMTVPWANLQHIHAQMGQQAYDMTPTLRIDLTEGKSIFLAEGERLWKPFVQALEKHLPEALSAAVWTTRLANDPEAGIVVYERPISRDAVRA